MRITAIKPRRKGLSQLYIDGEEAMKLDTVTLEMNRITEGTELDDEELHELVRKSEKRRAEEKALYLLEYRARSKKELVTRLKEELSPEAAEEAAGRMEDLGLVDDRAFAESYARQLFTVKKYGARRVRQEMYLKGIDREIVDEVVDEYGGDFSEKILDIISRKYPAYARDEKARRRAIAALQRMGYSFDEIREATRNIATGEEELYNE